MNWNSSNGSPCQLIIKGQLVSKAAIIASEMNKYFVDKIKTIQSGIALIPNNFEKCYQIMKGKRCKLGLGHVSICKVRRILKNIKSSKSTGIDGLDSYSIKVSADIIAQPMHHIVCLSVIQSRFPSSWKFSKVIPLHKKECKLEKKNYRPVAILSSLVRYWSESFMIKFMNSFPRTKFLMIISMDLGKIDLPFLHYLPCMTDGFVRQQTVKLVVWS